MHAPTTRDRSFHGRLVRRHVGVTRQGDVAVLGTEFDLILASRDAVIGVALDVWMVVPDWKRGVSNHLNQPGANFSALADHVDHIVQVTGTTENVGIGTDLDGGYGAEQSPSDLDTIADLKLFVEILRQRGYDDEAIQGICHLNFIQFLCTIQIKWG